MSVIKKHLLTLSAYRPPLEGRHSDTYTLLDFNERTIPVSHAVQQALHDYIDAGHLHVYPAYGNIVERLAHYTGASADQLMITNGSDQGIDLVFRAISTPGAEAIIPGPSFAMYTQCAKVEDMAIIEPQYTRTEGYPVNDVLAAITPNTKIIVISNPNNPCGTLVSSSVISTIAASAPHAAILVDECYFEYTQVTAVSILNDHTNIFITRTFSKTWGIPSLRFGYLLSSAENILALCNVRGPYDINQLAIVAANAALDHPENTQHYIAEVINNAKPLLESWLTEHHIEYWQSKANYLWCFPPLANKVNDYLRHQGFLVRPKAYGDRMGLRITIGTLQQTQQLIQIWDNWLHRSHT